MLRPLESLKVFHEQFIYASKDKIPPWRVVIMTQTNHHLFPENLKKKKI